jgi:hypothetical protein
MQLKERARSTPKPDIFSKAKVHIWIFRSSISLKAYHLLLSSYNLNIKHLYKPWSSVRSSSLGSSMSVISGRGILPTVSTRWSLPPWVLDVMIRWLEKRKHCLTASLSFSLPMLSLPRAPVRWLAGSICTNVPWRTNIWLTSNNMSQPSTIIRSMARFLRMFSVSLTYFVVEGQKITMCSKCKWGPTEYSRLTADCTSHGLNHCQNGQNWDRSMF